MSRAGDIPSGIVRILASDGTTAGTGFVVSKEGLILTCSHVVLDCGLQKLGRIPPESVGIIFLATGESAIAKVEPEYWRSCTSEDIAVLRSTSPLPGNIEPLPLVSSRHTSRERKLYLTFGFPKANPEEGLFGTGEILGQTSIQNGIPVLQLSSPQISRGFSGAPVWGRDDSLVIGMISDITLPDQYGRLPETVLLTPSETLASVCPLIDLWQAEDTEAGQTGKTIYISSTPEDFETFLSLNLIDPGPSIRILPETKINSPDRGWLPNWLRNIEEWIASTDVVFLVLSSKTFIDRKLSNTVSFELEACRDYGLPVVPIILGNLDEVEISTMLEYASLDGTPFLQISGSTDDKEHIPEILQALTKEPNDRLGLQKFINRHLAEIRSLLFSESLLFKLEVGVTGSSGLSNRLPSYVADKHPLSWVMSRVGDTTFDSLISCFSKIPRIALLGEPGSGKTFSLHQLARHLLRQIRNGEASSLPILLKLNNWGVNWSLLDFARAGIQARAPELDAGMFEDYLYSGRLIMLLDGLDEVSEVDKEKLYAAIRHLLQAFPSMPIVITCRIADYHPNTLPLQEVVLHELSSDVIQDYINNYPFKETSHVGNLLRILETNKYVERMAVIPYLLTVLCRIYASAPEVFKSIRGQGGLFREYVKLMISHDIGTRYAGSKSLTEEQVIQVIASIACGMFWEGRTVVGMEEVRRFAGLPMSDIKPALDYARDTYLIRFNNLDNSYFFPHLLLRNYFAALHMNARNQRFKRTARRLLNFLQPDNKSTSHGVHIQLFAFQDTFPDWESWPFNKFAKMYNTVPLSQSVTLVGLSIETLVEAFIHSRNGDIVKTAEKTLIQSSSEEVVYALAAQINDDRLLDWVRAKAVDQAILNTFLNYTVAIHRLMTVATRLGELTGGATSQNIARIHTAQFAVTRVQELTKALSTALNMYPTLRITNDITKRIESAPNLNYTGELVRCIEHLIEIDLSDGSILDPQTARRFADEYTCLIDPELHVLAHNVTIAANTLHALEENPSNLLTIELLNKIKTIGYSAYPLLILVALLHYHRTNSNEVIKLLSPHDAHKRIVTTILKVINSFRSGIKL
jgi:hypothetical protein